jgi:hypothetical protein
MAEPELITFGEAMGRLGVSKHTLARLVRDRGMKVYANPLDRREKLLDVAEVERARRPQLLTTEPESKLAA